MKENEDMTIEEIMENKEAEAKNRQVFDPIDKNYDARKRRATDLQECSRITLPKPLSPDEEANLDIRRRTQMEIFRKYKGKNTNKNGEQLTNLTKQEKEGLKSIQKRIQEGSIIVIKTDKSSKLAATTQEDYLRMGKEHVEKDKKITRQEVIDMEENLNGHNRAWANIWGSGKDHNHFERIIASKTTHSENLANLYLMYKDHKEGDKTRPTATGHSSNSLGLSNSVAEVLESVANSLDKRYNTISSEDMLARIHRYNKNIKPTLPTSPSPSADEVSGKGELQKIKNPKKVTSGIPTTQNPFKKNLPMASWGVPEPQVPKSDQIEGLSKEGSHTTPKPVASEKLVCTSIPNVPDMCVDVPDLKLGVMGELQKPKNPKKSN